MIGDILKKLADGVNLSDTEIQTLRLVGNQIEANNAFILGLQNGTGTVTARHIRALSGEIRYPPIGIGSSVYFARDATRVSTVPTATETMGVFYGGARYDELKGYTANSTIFRIPYSGKYLINLHARWNTATGGARQVKLLNVGYGYMPEYDSQHSSSASNGVTNFVIGEASLVGGSDISVELYQTSGGNLDVYGTMSIRLLRNFDGDTV